MMHNYLINIQWRSGAAGFAGRLLRRRFSAKEQALVAKRLALLTRSGMPILESLRVLREQSRSRSVREVFDDLIAGVEGGRYLSASLDGGSRIFGEFGVNVIRVGELSGGLTGNLEYLAEELRKRHQLRQKIAGAMAYPLFVSAATIAVTGMLVAYIFPKIMPIFLSMDVQLPLATRIVLGAAGFLQRFGVLLLILIAVVAAAAAVCIGKVSAVRRAVDRAVLRAPLVGAIVRAYNLSNSCRTLGMLLASGLPAAEALSATADATANTAYRTQFESVAGLVAGGGSIAAGFGARRDLFPDMCVQLAGIGERTGSLADVLAYLAETYEDDLDDLTKGLSASIEPLLMIVMGILVGFVALSIITPIYGITQSLAN